MDGVNILRLIGGYFLKMKTKEVTKMTIGENVKMLRERKGMTQRELGEKLLVTPTMITNIERDKKMPSLQLTAHLALVLDCTPNEITGFQKIS